MLKVNLRREKSSEEVLKGDVTTGMVIMITIFRNGGKEKEKNSGVVRILKIAKWRRKFMKNG